MNQVERLISKLCPEGVRHHQITDVFEIRNGYTPSKAKEEYWNNPTIPWIRLEDIRTFGRVLDCATQYIHESGVRPSGVFQANSIIISTLATIGEHALVTVPFTANQQITILTINEKFKRNLDPKFAFYYCFNLAEYCRAHTSTSGFASVNMRDFKKFSFPVPPLEVQKEIVRILDTFTELEAELEAELELRKTQQIHYRNHFFSKAILSKYCPNGVPEHSLGSLLIANRGGGTPSTAKPDYWDGEIPWASIGDLNACRMYISETRRTITDAGLKSGATSLVKAGDVLAAVKISPGLMKIASRDVAINQDIRGLTLDPRLDAAFLVYFFRTFSIIANGSIVKGITNATLEKVKVPVPPLEVQHEIVTALNAMNELELSLETELLARRSQYEFYRNRLLTFKELEVS